MAAKPFFLSISSICWRQNQREANRRVRFAARQGARLA